MQALAYVAREALIHDTDGQNCYVFENDAVDTLWMSLKEHFEARKKTSWQNNDEATGGNLLKLHAFSHMHTNVITVITLTSLRLCS